MAHMVKVFGVEEIKAAIKRADRRLSSAFGRGLIKAGLFLQRESQKIVPVDTSNLKNSAGTKSAGHGWYMEVVVYYTADYAVYVHERTELRHKEGKFAKFLEKPAREQKDRILKIIAGEAKRI